ncbi:MAG: tRNA pseudouridine(55) synthase TruB [Puniceicoccales bacterium]|nr:tRNA pseudouridine(55) synthase TruB [Puniceicoccales bacterium]
MNTSNLDGVLLVDKPRGITSHDVIAKLRHLLGTKKIGHAGTLDPMATGLLIILIGRTTKISQYLVDLSKGYEGTMKLGISTDSHDVEGKVLENHDVVGISMEGLKILANEFIGDQYQMPPMFSAKKVNGKKLYELARKGKIIDREPQFIHIGTFEIDNLRDDEVDFFVHCSKGTYVRTLVNDFGERLKCGAHLSRLCRTIVGNFSINDALTMEEISQIPIFELSKRLIPAYDVVPSQVVR